MFIFSHHILELCGKEVTGNYALVVASTFQSTTIIHSSTYHPSHLSNSIPTFFFNPLKQIRILILIGAFRSTISGNDWILWWWNQSHPVQCQQAAHHWLGLSIANHGSRWSERSWDRIPGWDILGKLIDFQPGNNGWGQGYGHGHISCVLQSGTYSHDLLCYFNPDHFGRWLQSIGSTGGYQGLGYFATKRWKVRPQLCCLAGNLIDDDSFAFVYSINWKYIAI